MDLAAARTFLETNHRAILATRKRNASPQLSPVVVGLDEHGLLLMSTRETAYKTANMRRDPHVSLCVFSDGFYGQWIQVDGTAEIVSLPDALDGLVTYYRAVSGEHPDWDDYRAAMQRERRVLVRITIADVGPDRSG
jgi:PPOX class probable F420-dependent enzyme